MTYYSNKSTLKFEAAKLQLFFQKTRYLKKNGIFFKFNFCKLYNLLLNSDKITETFCIADDFCKEFGGDFKSMLP